MGLPFLKWADWWDKVEGWIGDQGLVSGPDGHLNEDVKEATGYMTGFQGRA